MRTSIAGAVILLAGAGATTAAATSGSNLALSGSDTLYEVTRDVISACSGVFPAAGTGFATKGMSYLGGGSGVGLGQMQLLAQEIAPMSRAMKSTEYCGGTPDLAADLMVGLDGVAVIVSKGSSCSTVATGANNVGNPSFTIQPGGTGAGGTVTYTLSATLGQSIDALRVLYMGIDQTAVTSGANFGCGTDLRKTLIKNWRNLFTTDCAAGDAHCPAGLSHAWRRPDVSGTTDAFSGVLLTTAGAGRSLGTMGNVPTGAAQKINGFCNTFEANDSNHQPQYLDGQSTLSDGITTTALSDGRVNDESDKDPVRTPCDVNDTVCNPDGTLGVVLPIFLPDVTTYSNAEIYPTTECSLSCTLMPIIKGTFLPPKFKCPVPLSSGAPNLAGNCFVPKSPSGDPRCLVTDPTARCVGTVAGKDARAYNQSVVVLSSEVPSGFRPAGATYQYGLDRNNRILAGAFYREHMQAPSSYNTRTPDTNYTGTCLSRNDTEQIGCLADADDCSLGYAGREAAQTFPGAGTPPAPPLDTLKALAVDGTPPFNPTGNPDQSVLNLLGTGTRYKIARRLYVAAGPAGVGFAGLPAGSGEDMLAKCFSKDSLVGPALTANGYIPIPSALGGVQCLDYDQTKATPDVPVNTQGTGNIALPGCATASAANGCLNVDNGHGYLFGL